MPCMDPLHVNDLAMSFCRGFNLAFCLSAWDNALMLGIKDGQMGTSHLGKMSLKQELYVYVCVSVCMYVM